MHFLEEKVRQKEMQIEHSMGALRRSIWNCFEPLDRAWQFGSKKAPMCSFRACEAHKHEKFSTNFSTNFPMKFLDAFFGAKNQALSSEKGPSYNSCWLVLCLRGRLIPKQDSDV